MDSNSAKLWVKSAGTAMVRITFYANGESVRSTDWVGLSPDKSWTTVVTMSDLKPSTKYAYTVELSDKQSSNMGGSFTTFPEPGTRKNFRFK